MLILLMILSAFFHAKVAMASDPQGALLDSASGSDFIAVVYTRDGNIYYNQVSEGETWDGEVLLGTGTEGRMAIGGSDNPHVAYTTTDGKIGYRVRGEGAWSAEALIESNYDGVCKLPDIDVDSAGDAHITYTDTMGDTAGTQNHDDIMYAKMQNGALVTKTLLYSGYYDSYSKWGRYYEKGSLIAMDGDDNRYIFYQARSYDHGWGVYHDRWISVSGATSVTLGSVSSNTNRFDIYDLKSSGGKIYALYRDGTNIKATELTVNVSGEITGTTDKVVIAASSAYSLASDGVDVVIGSKDGDNLRIHHNETPETFADIEVSGAAVSIVRLGGQVDDTYHAVYTDADDGAIKITGDYAASVYTLTYTAGDNGSITGEISQTVEPGAAGSEVTAVPDEGYHFVQWSDGSTANPRADIGVTENITVTANFAINEYTLTYTAGANGSITGTSLQTVSHGADGSVVEAVPAEGYHFVQWSDGSTANPRTDTGITGNLMVTASFVINKYTLTYTAGANGLVVGDASQTVEHGTDGSEVTAVPAGGYHFVRWSDGSTANPRTDTGVTGNLTVAASFAINEYTLTYTAGANGAITGISPQTVNHGADGSVVEGVPAEGYHFVQWSDGSTANPRTDTGIAGNLTVTASFAVNEYTLTYTAGDNGSVTGTSPQMVSHGADGSAVEAVADEGYHFVQWSDGSTDNPRTDNGVTGNVTVTASFAINEYTMTYTAGDNGAITGTSPQTVNHGADGSAVEAVPAEGYHFVQWSDGTTDNPRTDTGVTENITVTATFTQVFDDGDGTEGNPYHLSTPAQLHSLRDFPASHFTLAGDLDLTAYADGAGWEPIGTADTPFTGGFDGGGFAITGLTIDRAGMHHVGLFGYVVGAAIQNVALEDVDISGSRYVGGLVGYATDSTITGSYVTGSVTGGSDGIGGLVGMAANSTIITDSHSSVEVTGSERAGGLVGSLADSTITDAHATGSVESNSVYSYVGGLVGYNTNSTINDSYATGTVTGSSYVGGLVGYNRDSSIISNSYATGVVEGKWDVGGLVGDNYVGSTITNSYATGNVTGTENRIGGLAGANSNEVTNSYSTGLVVGGGQVGGLIGQKTGTVTASYYNSETSGQSDTGKGEPKTTEEMKQQTTYADWDFDTVWSLDGVNNDGYPYLAWQMDTRPDAFAFTAQTGVARNTVVESDTITVSGIDAPSPISIDACTGTDCQYRIGDSGWGAWTAEAGTVENGIMVQVRQTSSGSYATTTVLTLDIGGESGNFSVTTMAIPQYTVTASAASAVSGGSVSPASRVVDENDTASFTVSADSGYSRSNSVGGTCSAGSWSGSSYTTGSITANCSVSFSFIQDPAPPSPAPEPEPEPEPEPTPEPEPVLVPELTENIDLTDGLPNVGAISVDENAVTGEQVVTVRHGVDVVESVIRIDGLGEIRELNVSAGHIAQQIINHRTGVRLQLDAEDNWRLVQPDQELRVVAATGEIIHEVQLADERKTITENRTASSVVEIQPDGSLLVRGESAGGTTVVTRTSGGGLQTVNATATGGALPNIVRLGEQGARTMVEADGTTRITLGAQEVVLAPNGGEITYNGQSYAAGSRLYMSSTGVVLLKERVDPLGRWVIIASDDDLVVAGRLDSLLDDVMVQSHPDGTYEARFQEEDAGLVALLRVDGTVEHLVTTSAAETSAVSYLDGSRTRLETDEAGGVRVRTTLGTEGEDGYFEIIANRDGVTSHRLRLQGEEVEAISTIPGTRTVLDVDRQGLPLVRGILERNGWILRTEAALSGRAGHAVERKNRISTVWSAVPGARTLVAELDDGKIEVTTSIGMAMAGRILRPRAVTLDNGETRTGFEDCDSSGANCRLATTVSEHTPFEAGNRVTIDRQDEEISIIVRVPVSRQIDFE